MCSAQPDLQRLSTGHELTGPPRPERQVTIPAEQAGVSFTSRKFEFRNNLDSAPALLTVACLLDSEGEFCCCGGNRC
jgi:hypothetical protein